MTTPARYDAAASFYAAGWPDSYDDPATHCLLGALGDVHALSVLDVACGHGRLTRELARRGAARVVGLDLSAELLDRAEAIEREQRLGISYLKVDASDEVPELERAGFDAAVCSFGLSDIDDLDGAVATVSRALRPAGIFAFSILHPCFPGTATMAGAWPPDASYYDDTWWLPTTTGSALRIQVGSNHRMLSSYFTALTRAELRLTALHEPRPSADWGAARADASRFPVFLVAACTRA